MTRFAFDEQVRGQAEAVERALARTDPPELDPLRPLVLTGIGTSLHACRVASCWVEELSRGRVHASAVQAHELALGDSLRRGDQVVVVSHRGTKRFTSEVLERAHEVGAVSIAVSGDGNPNVGGDHVLRTCPDERASTHTVSYLTALAVLGKLVARLLGEEAAGFASALEGVPRRISETLREPEPIEVARRLQARVPLILSGFGIDEITAQEAALKLKEGAYQYSEGMAEEFALHGTPAVFDGSMGAIVITPGRSDGSRAQELRALLMELGLEVATCGVGETDLPFAEVDYLLRPFVAIVPLQRLVGELARLRGTNPDTTRGDQEPWATAIPRVRL